MPLPHMVFNDGPVPFSQHLKIPGSSLESADYLRLGEGQRNALATRMAQLYFGAARAAAQPHAAGRRHRRRSMDGARRHHCRGRPKLPRGYKGFLDRTVSAYRKLTITGDEQVYGYFDGHGWNMAFDHEMGLLNGVFDFADSGFGARHRDLSYSNWISADLTLRIIDRYEELTRRSVNRDLVMLYSSALRLAELAEGFCPRNAASPTSPAGSTSSRAWGFYSCSLPLLPHVTPDRRGWSIPRQSSPQHSHRQVLWPTAHDVTRRRPESILRCFTPLRASAKHLRMGSGLRRVTRVGMVR